MKRYEGRPCNKCGGTTRYTCNSHCVSCQAKQKKEWNDRNREHVREYERKRVRPMKNAQQQAGRYGLTVGDVDRMKEEAGHRCQICGGTKPLCVDHDHTTGKVRGVLCSECNLGLGKFDDDPALLILALTYMTGGA